MKKIITILIIAITLLASCKKNNDTKNTSCTTAVVRYGGNPAADGVGWYLMVGDSTGGTPEYPQNLAVTYMKEGLAVNVCYYKSDKDFSCFCAPPLPKMIIITSISKR